MVMGCWPIFFSVNASPFASSLITGSPSSSLCAQGDNRARHDDVDEAKWQQHFPPEIHEPVVAEPRQGPAHPDHHEEKHEHLAEEPDRPGDPVEGMERQERQPATEEQ